MKADAIITMRNEWHEDLLNPGAGYCTETPIRWEGGPVARVSWEMLPLISRDRMPNVGEYVYLGPWLLEVIEVGGFASRDIFVTRNLNWAWWYALRFRVARHWPPFKNRVIATCAVWGLARYDWTARPSWSQIYVVAWLKRKLRRL